MQMSYPGSVLMARERQRVSDVCVCTCTSMFVHVDVCYLWVTGEAARLSERHMYMHIFKLHKTGHVHVHRTCTYCPEAEEAARLSDRRCALYMHMFMLGMCKYMYKCLLFPGTGEAARLPGRRGALRRGAAAGLAI